MSDRKKIAQSITGRRHVRGGSEIELTYRIGNGTPVPSILLLPSRPHPIPAAVLLHGFSSRKEVMSHAVGRCLFDQGIASLAIDLPLHGTRADPLQAQTARNPIAMLQMSRTAIAEVRTAIHYLTARPEVDRDRIALAGYSMGSFLAVTVAADQPLVKAVILAAGGDLPDNTPFTTIARMAADPMRAVAKLNGRPLLMIHGKTDRTVTPSQAQRLFDAAKQPKRINWYDSGHYLPQQASVDAAQWLAAEFTAA